MKRTFSGACGLRAACLAGCLFASTMPPAAYAQASDSAVQSWRGRQTVEDGITHVLNPSEPADAAQILELREQWRISGDADSGGLVLGTIAEIQQDPGGNFYLLDSQLNNVHVVSPEGKHLRDIGRAGEGPGEFQWPMGLLAAGPNRIGVLDAVGQKIVFLKSDGTPDGEWKASFADEQTHFSPLFSWVVPGGILLSFQLRSRNDRQVIDRDLIGLFGSDNTLAKTACEKVRTRSLDQPFVFDEGPMESYSFLAVQPDGRLYVSSEYETYRIDVFDADLNPVMVIERECAPVPRTPEQVADVRATWEAFYRRLKNPEIRVEDNRRAILSLRPREDGNLWVETSRGWVDRPPGTCVAFDAIDEDGRFTHQVALAGQIDPWEDYLYIFGDRALVWTAGFAAVQGSMGVADHTDSSAESESSVICYALVPR